MERKNLESYRTLDVAGCRSKAWRPAATAKVEPWPVAVGKGRWRIGILLLGITLAGCSGMARLERASHEELARHFQAAVDDAETALPEEISQGLHAVVPSNPSLRWRARDSAAASTGTELDEDTDRDVLAVTWTDWHGYDDSVGSEIELGRDVWTTLVPDLQEFCRNLPSRRPKAVGRRLEQLLGLPPDDGRDRFVEMWVRPIDLFRPCPDPEVSDRECELDFPLSAYSTLNPHYKTWFENLVSTMYGDGGYPWTRLGYTYDWGRRRGNVGLSELIIRKGSRVTVAAVYEDLDYCRSPASP